MQIELKPGRNVVQPDGTLLSIPRRFTARAQNVALAPFKPDKDGDFEVELEVEVDERGRASCRSFTCRGPNVTGSALRLPLRDLVQDATAEAARVAYAMEHGTATPSRPDILVELSTRIPRKGKRLSDDHYREVAELYQALVRGGIRGTGSSLAPGPAIAERYGVSVSTVKNRWLPEARRRGHLGEAKRNTAGESALPAKAPDGQMPGYVEVVTPFEAVPLAFCPNCRTGGHYLPPNGHSTECPDCGFPARRRMVLAGSVNSPAS